MTEPRESVEASNLHIRTYEDRWHHPGARYCVARRAKAVVPFRKLSEAKAWVVEHYGPMTWTKVPRPRYNESDAWWPTPKAEHSGSTQGDSDGR